ncbi:hypothetical protein K488DRAFT_49015 [Vararia minispora EC-137]|uniref:Uncharacterized protein n=1 Tax=Vararia minispora EC-137 TaxID=1314806 RepID=A0ACB8QM40_9AGAM|nr:hypothetical protein K488DRAFT_49015 [Vararia minispora EC-137]
MSRRLYLGKLPPDARSEEVTKIFDGYGKIVDCKVMTGFGFVEFDSSRDAEDAVQQFNGKSFMGQNIVVEFAKESRPRRDPYLDDRARARRPPGIRVVVTGISRDTSWQDLKDFGREAGSVSFADIDRDLPGQGVLEYLVRDDAERAVKELDGKDLRGQPVRVQMGDDRGADNYRRDDRGYDRGYDRDRYRDDRDRHERDRSPPRRGEDDRRPRSPPPRRDDDRRPAGYDDRRGGYYNDRRGPDPYYDRRRDEDRRRDDRRRDDKDYDDRAPTRNGDAGWSR